MARTTRRLPSGNDRITLRRKAADLYLDGCTIRSVARQIGRPYTTTYELLAEAGVKFRPRGGNTGKAA
ncbi:helix-turn-helix domain-containing protein [Streptomyces adelaidensis]|uniref:helix-turn-helix domain-containing protein n=1 Tax=Streptomyces adelaidensis TaxID=2796465 RepID=UPI0019059A4D|nr:helix-turn-helix domain-containing protein [Streptomyces adelaidensis]